MEGSRTELIHMRWYPPLPSSSMALGYHPCLFVSAHCTLTRSSLEMEGIPGASITAGVLNKPIKAYFLPIKAPSLRQHVGRGCIILASCPTAVIKFSG